MFVKQLKKCTKLGSHNPPKYLLYGEVAARMGQVMDDPEVEHFFTKLIQSVMPKSDVQCLGEVKVTKMFLKTFAGDATRFAVGRGFSVSGDHAGQESKGYRWPYGPVVVVSPFNFPLEIPALQTMGALLAGNRVLVKPAEKVAIVMDQFARLMLACGAPKEDFMLLNGSGKTAEHIITNPIVRLTQFTGSSNIAERLAEKTHGKVRIEDAGFNWKILGPRKDITPRLIDYVGQISDQDAYAASGQKCSAQSALFVHDSWNKAGIVKTLGELSRKRKFEDLTIVPVLTWTTEQMLNHVNKCLKTIPNCKIEFGGKALQGKGTELVPKQYGLFEPTALRCNVTDVLSSPEAFAAFSTELFGPFQMIVDYNDDQIDQVIECCERMSHHLTAAVVSNDPNFLHKVLSNTVNGTTYAGIRARTTGAPTNHWFGPAGDPRGAGIGTIESILHVWTCHREIIYDVLDPSESWVKQEKPT